MIRTIARVLAGEGIASAIVRTEERVGEAVHDAMLRRRSPAVPAVDVLNVVPQRIAPRTGGVAVQFAARISAERAMRTTAVLDPRGLELSAPFAHLRRVRDVSEAISITNARLIHLENMHGVDSGEVLRWIGSGKHVVATAHDFSLWSTTPHAIDDRVDPHRRELGRRLLQSVIATIFPSEFLLREYRRLFELPLTNAHVIEPASAATSVAGGGSGIAYAGSVKRHKGGHLLPEIAAALAERRQRLHVFGGGDADLLRSLRRQPNVVVHGYYRAGSLPALLARHQIGRVVLPSIWPETFSLTLSESWLAGASVIAFDVGAIAERIRHGGGGMLVPLERGAAGLIDAIDRWQPAPVPAVIPAPMDAARAHVELYRTLLA